MEIASAIVATPPFGYPMTIILKSMYSLTKPGIHRCKNNIARRTLNRKFSNIGTTIKRLTWLKIQPKKNSTVSLCSHTQVVVCTWVTCVTTPSVMWLLVTNAYKAKTLCNPLVGMHSVYPLKMPQLKIKQHQHHGLTKTLST